MGYAAAHLVGTWHQDMEDVSYRVPDDCTYHPTWADAKAEAIKIFDSVDDSPPLLLDKILVIGRTGLWEKGNHSMEKYIEFQKGQR